MDELCCTTDVAGDGGAAPAAAATHATRRRHPMKRTAHPHQDTILREAEVEEAAEARGASLAPQGP